MFDDDSRLSEVPVSQWSDARIRAVLGVGAARRDTAAAAGDQARAERWNDLLRTLAAERDSRAALAVAVDDASATVAGVWAAVPDVEGG